MRLIISEPESANSSTSGCSVPPAICQAPPHSAGPTAPVPAATHSRPTNTMEVGIGVPSKYATLPEPAYSASAVTLKRASRDTPQATK